MTVKTVKVVDVKDEVKGVVQLLHKYPSSVGILVKVCVGFDKKRLTIVFGPNNYIHKDMLFEAMNGVKPVTRGGSKIRFFTKGGKIVASWTEDVSLTLGPVPEELEEIIMRELQTFLQA